MEGMRAIPKRDIRRTELKVPYSQTIKVGASVQDIRFPNSKNIFGSIFTLKG